MIKGARRQLIVLRTGDSCYFDEAYFILKSEKGDKNVKSGDLVKEANRILCENLPPQKNQKRSSPRPWIAFFCGIFCGAAMAVLWALFFL